MPLVPVGPNQRPKKLRERMALVRRERTVAQAQAMVAKNSGPHAPFFSGTVTFEVHRGRLLDFDNLCGSIKHVQDGVVAALLPEGDGPTAPYTWIYRQVRAKRGEDKGVKVTIEARA